MLHDVTVLISARSPSGEIQRREHVIKAEPDRVATLLGSLPEAILDYLTGPTAQQTAAELPPDPVPQPTEPLEGGADTVAGAADTIEGAAPPAASDGVVDHGEV